MDELDNKVSKNIKYGKVTADFATIASHQLRTPISIIRWSLDILKSKKFGNLNSRQEDFIEQAYDQNVFMARIVNDLLKISRLESGELLIHSEKINLVHLVKNIVKKYEDLAHAYNSTITMKISRNIPTIITDKLKIRDIISTLIDNAIRYSYEKNKVNIEIKEVNGFIYFKIADTGIGITPNQQGRVFTKFFRGNNAMKLQTQGLGLQLYITKHLIQALGGKIWFYSKYFHGSTFYFTLPCRYKPMPLAVFKEPIFRFTEDILEYFYEHINDGLIVINSLKKILKINTNACKVLRCHPHQSIRKKIYKLFRVPELKKAMEDVESGGKSVSSFQYKDILGSEIIIYKVTVFPIIHYATVEGWIIIIHTLGKKSTSYLAESELLEKEREMVSITVHELKNPLGVTKWSLEMLSTERLGKLNAKQKELIEQISLGNQRLLILVSDLLNLSRIEEGKFEIKSRIVNPIHIIKEVIFETKPNFKNKNLILRLQFSKSCPKVRADTRRIMQVVTNLISNAIKYTPSGRTISCGIKKVNKDWLKKVSMNVHHKIHFLDNNKGYVLFWVKDTGIGITKTQQKYIFTKFYRGKQIMQSKIEGTGLGLYITKSIVHLHKGDIWFESTPDVGSTFYFTLPIV